MTLRSEYRLNGVRFAGHDPAAALAGAAIVVAIDDARDRAYPERRAEAVAWLRGQGARWCSLLGGDEPLADVLAEIDG